MNIAIAGYGISGKAAENLAKILDFNVIIVDGAPVENTMSPFLLADLIVLSPGIPPWSELYIAAVHSGVEIVSELEFAYRYLPENIKTVAITGTNGKTTTVEMTAELLNRRGIKSIACGNIGVALSEIVADILSERLVNIQCLVIEVSSFQLERVKEFAPDVAAITNIVCDHLDRYENNLEIYAKTKFEIFNNTHFENRFLGVQFQQDPKQQKLIPAEFQFKNDLNSLDKEKSDDYFIMNADDFSFSNSKISADQLISIHNNFEMKYFHNMDNLQLAINFSHKIKKIEESEYPTIEAFIEGFQLSPHRIEFIAEKNNIQFVNDSKATNPDAVITAIKAVKNTGNAKYLTIMLGGLNKGMDFSVLKEYSNDIQFLAIYGECKNELYKLLSEEFNCKMFSTFDGAFNGCIKNIKANSDELAVVMLSPGCASMDMFKNYAERGEEFRKLVLNL